MGTYIGKRPPLVYDVVALGITYGADTTLPYIFRPEGEVIGSLGAYPPIDGLYDPTLPLGSPLPTATPKPLSSGAARFILLFDWGAPSSPAGGVSVGGSLPCYKQKNAFLSVAQLLYKVPY